MYIYMYIYGRVSARLEGICRRCQARTKRKTAISRPFLNIQRTNIHSSTSSISPKVPPRPAAQMQPAVSHRSRRRQRVPTSYSSSPKVERSDGRAARLLRYGVQGDFIHKLLSVCACQTTLWPVPRGKMDARRAARGGRGQGLICNLL